jgi:hypothetical protein
MVKWDIINPEYMVAIKDRKPIKRKKRKPKKKRTLKEWAETIHDTKKEFIEIAPKHKRVPIVFLPEEPPPPPSVSIHAHSREFAIRLAKNLQWDKYVSKGHYEKHRKKVNKRAEWLLEKRKTLAPIKKRKVPSKFSPKYNNQRCVYEGITFDSLREKDRYIFLKYMVRQNVIYDLEIQPKYILESEDKGPLVVKSETRKTKLTYTADFRYKLTLTNEEVVEDVKSIATMEEYAFKVKRAIWEWLHKKELKVVVDVRSAPGKTLY